jgi:hypothetical protein
MEHYVQTGEVLGKGTHLLEGYTFLERGYFGPGELPQFDRQFFEIPHGRKEDWLFQQFKERLMNEVPTEADVATFAKELRGILVKGNSTMGDE